ncbi:uncharacterized protein LOC111260917 [Varroa jacobsoni]|uniref:Chitin-binding type-2 domain-containing protein n=1 Tax=Varroa destructor TaxID=109461 RepID=A0A7M7J4A4_VARDE|nr:uncharacterized protein LOC111244161 [Varroa destructor]XP_022689759.1 uncharacterized protein LOC111260917 [Varroa jacobsoni]
MMFLAVACCLMPMLALEVQAKPFSFGPGSPDCPPDATMNSQLVPDPNDCTMYSRCSFWFSAKFTCRFGQHFSPTHLRCMDPRKAGCDPAYDITTPASTTEKAPTTRKFFTASSTAAPTEATKTEAIETEAPVLTEAAKTEVILAEAEASPAETAAATQLL